MPKTQELSLLEKTPEEVIFLILAFLSAEELTFMMLACRLFRRLADDNVLWQRQVNRRFSSQAQCLNQFLHPAFYPSSDEKSEETPINPLHFRRIYACLHRNRQSQFGLGTARLVNWSQYAPVQVTFLPRFIPTALGLKESRITVSEICDRLQRCDADGKCLLDHAYGNQTFLDAIFQCVARFGPETTLKETQILAALTNQIDFVNEEYLQRIPRTENGRLTFTYDQQKIFYQRFMGIALRYGYLHLLENFAQDERTIVEMLTPYRANTYPGNSNLLCTANYFGLKVVGTNSQPCADWLFQRLQTYVEALEDPQQTLRLGSRSYTRSALLFAVASQLNQVTYLQSCLNQTSDRGEPPHDKKTIIQSLKHSVNHGAIDVVKLLIETHVITPTDAPRLLRLASHYGHPAIAEYLIEKGWGVNAEAPLLACVRQNHVNVLLLLLRRGADPAITDENGRDSFTLTACSRRRHQNPCLTIQTMEILRRAQPEKACLHDREKSLLDICTQEGGSLEFARYLLKQSIVPTEQTLNNCLCDPQSKLFELLLDHLPTFTLSCVEFELLINDYARGNGCLPEVIEIVELLYQKRLLNHFSHDELDNSLYFIRHSFYSHTQTAKHFSALLQRVKMSTHEKYPEYESDWDKGDSLKDKIADLIKPYSKFQLLRAGAQRQTAINFLEALERIPNDAHALFDFIESYAGDADTVHDDLLSSLSFILDRLDEARKTAVLQQDVDEHDAPPVEYATTLTVRCNNAPKTF